MTYPADSSLTQEWRHLLRYRELLRSLIAKDLKVKYRGSYLGFLWSLLNPLALIVVYSLVLKVIMGVREIEPLMVIAGIIPWVFFANTITNSTESIISNANLVKQIFFPREILPLSTVLFHFIQFLLAFAVFLPAVMFFKGGRLPWTLAYYPLILVLHWTFTAGAALFLSAATTFYKDIRYLTEVAIMMVFWATPILYTYPMVASKDLAWLFWFNPLSPFFFSYQNVVHFEQPPRPEHLIAMLFWSILMLVLGTAVFRKTRDRFAEEL
ncbi:MAG: ABC transporter permease [Acidobacteriota bacterium]